MQTRHPQTKRLSPGTWLAIVFCSLCATTVFTSVSLAQPATSAAETSATETPATEASTAEPERVVPTLAARTVKLSDDRLVMVAPESWDVKKPRSNIVEYEFAIPAPADSEGKDAVGRLTIMGAGGGVEANVARWIGQFRGPDGVAVANAAKPNVTKVAGESVYWVDLSGTYADKPRGPFGPSTNRPGYRMLAAIIATEKHGQYFVKSYGPSKTISAAEEGFKEFIKSLKVENNSGAASEKSESQN